MCNSAPADSPSDKPGEEDGGCAGECGEHADAGERCAEERDAEPRLERDDGAVVDVAPVEMLSAKDVVHLVAEISPSDVGFPEIRPEVESELQQCEEASKQESLTERRVLRSRDPNCGLLEGTGGCVHGFRAEMFMIGDAMPRSTDAIVPRFRRAPELRFNRLQGKQ